MYLILAPTGRDASIATTLLGNPTIGSVVCSSVAELRQRLSDEVDLAVVADEALRSADLRPLAEWVRNQASWSDLPFIVMTRQGRGPQQEAGLARISEALGNATFLERPFRRTIFASIVGAALKARRRQREVRLRMLELHEGERRLRTALKAGRLGAWELDLSTHALTATEECKVVFGRPEGSDFPFKQLVAQIHPADTQCARRVLLGEGDDEEDRVLTLRVLWPDGEMHWAELRAKRTQGPDGRARLVGVAADVTERRTFVETLKQLNETLEQRVADRTAALERAHVVVLKEIEQRQRTETLLRQAQKMEMIGQLTGGVAHDFNNLLMVILGNLTLLRKRIAGDLKAERWIEGAMEGADRGAALTRRLLAFARRQDLVVELKDVGSLVNGMRDLMRSSIAPGIELCIEVPGELPPARLDSVQVELAVLNLVINARDAMPKGGRLSVSVEVTEQDSGNGLAPGTYVRVTVTDTGTGMNKETLAKATEPFFSTKEVGKGTGLGLSMVDGLARQLNGALRLHSEAGHGTRAELWLPVAHEKIGVSVPSRASTVERGAPARARILLVDDDALVASSTAALLEELGHEVTVAQSPAKALEIIRSSQPIDLVVTDFLMPQMNGSQLAKEAKRDRPDLPVLLVTGYAELSEGWEKDLPRLSKPFRLRDLQSQLARLLH